MKQIDHQINLDRAIGAEDNASKEEAAMRNSSTKTPWYLRFAPGAILRPIGRLVSKVVSPASAIIQPLRQRLNQWNWRKKTALVTALAITAGGVFYQQRAHAAALLGPILAAKPADFLVKFFIGYAIGTALNSAFAKKLQKTAAATPVGFLYSNREYNVRDYSFDDSGTKTENYGVDADANALYHKAYETSGTDTRLDPSTLEQRQVLDYVSHNTHLNGTTEEYQILHYGEPLYQWDGRRPSRRWLQTYAVKYGGYVKKLTAAEMQEELDDYREEWNRGFRRGYVSPHRRPFLIGPLTLGPKVSQVDKRFVCDKEVRLWSDFEFNRIPGDTDPDPKELQSNEGRSTYVTSFKYRAREAGYGPYYGLITTKTPQNGNDEFIEYPKPLSYTDHSYMPHQLKSITWANYKIIGDPVFSGSAKRYYKSKSRKRWCKFCERSHRRRLRGIGPFPSPCTPGFSNTTRYEYKVFQNESVKEPSN